MLSMEKWVKIDIFRERWVFVSVCWQLWAWSTFQIRQSHQPLQPVKKLTAKTITCQCHHKSRENLELGKKKVSIICSKTYLKWPLSKRSKIGFQKQLLLHAGQKKCRMGSTLSYYLSLRSLFCLFQWPFYCNSLHIAAHMIYYLGLDVRKPDIVVCKQQRCRLAWSSAQFDQQLCS